MAASLRTAAELAYSESGGVAASCIVRINLSFACWHAIFRTLLLFPRRFLQDVEGDLYRQYRSKIEWLRHGFKEEGKGGCR